MALGIDCLGEKFSLDLWMVADSEVQQRISSNNKGGYTPSTTLLIYFKKKKVYIFSK